MAWETVLKVDKGIFAGRDFVTGDMSGEITFTEYSADYNNFPTVATGDFRDPEAFQGQVIPDMETFLTDISPDGNVSKRLLWAIKVAHDVDHPLGGTYICCNFWSRNFNSNPSGCDVYIGVEFTKRVYVDDVAFVETYPFGNYWPDGYYWIRKSDGAPWVTGKLFLFFFKTATFSNVKNVVMGMARLHDDGNVECYGSGLGLRVKDSFWKSAGGMGTDAEDPSGEKRSPEFGPAAKPMGGYVPGGGTIPGKNVTKKPTFDNSSDRITVSAKPTHSALSSRFFHAYVVTDTSMQYIADALFPQPVFSQPDLIDAMGELAQIMFFNKQIDYMLDALILPITVPCGNWEAIRVGGRELKTVVGGTEITINGQPVSSPYVDFSCQSISIDEYWVNFLDFAGTKVKLFLPYVGYVDIQPEYVIGGTLYVDYRFNVIDGSFMCYVRSKSGYSQLDESLVGQYAGVAAQHIPLQSQDYSNKISGLISAIGSVAAGAASGGVGAAVGVGAAASAGNTLVQKPGSSHANGYNASSSFLSHRTPYVIIERQWSQFSEKYPEEIGLPTNSAQKIGNLYGLVKSENAHLDTIPCSAEGKDKIAALLREGIIV